jgi:hypothetical protein
MTERGRQRQRATTEHHRQFSTQSPWSLQAIRPLARDCKSDTFDRRIRFRLFEEIR